MVKNLPEAKFSDGWTAVMDFIVRQASESGASAEKSSEFTTSLLRKG